VLLRQAYLGLTNTFAMLRLLPMSNRDKDIEILALRHQIGVLQRQLGGTRVRFSPADRAFRRAPEPTPTTGLAQAPAAGAPGHNPALAP
jgi:putative transposase